MQVDHLLEAFAEALTATHHQWVNAKQRLPNICPEHRLFHFKNVGAQDTSGYLVTENDLRRSAFNVAVACAAGYRGAMML